MVRQLHLGNAATLATELGSWPEVALAAIAVMVLLAAGLVRRTRRRGDGRQQAEQWESE
jgi:apolipoprotein N-acyltransferase